MTGSSTTHLPQIQKIFLVRRKLLMKVSKSHRRRWRQTTTKLQSDDVYRRDKLCCLFPKPSDLYRLTTSGLLQDQKKNKSCNALKTFLTSLLITKQSSASYEMAPRRSFTKKIIYFYYSLRFFACQRLSDRNLTRVSTGEQEKDKNKYRIFFFFFLREDLVTVVIGQSLGLRGPRPRHPRKKCCHVGQKLTTSFLNPDTACYCPSASTESRTYCGIWFIRR